MPHDATLNTRWKRNELLITEEDLIDSPRTGGMYRLTEEAFQWVRSNELSNNQKVNLTSWIFHQRGQGKTPPVVTLEIIRSRLITCDNPTSINKRSEKLMRFLVNQTTTLGSKVAFNKNDSIMLIATDSVEWAEISTMLEHLQNQGLVEFRMAGDLSMGEVTVTVMGHNYIEESSRNATETTKGEIMTTEQNTDEIIVFVSHDSDDSELAKLLADLFQKSLRFPHSAIRCSSVDGYRLPGGVTTNEMLRLEVHAAKLVIGLITPSSLQSLYVAFELGARWGAEKPMIPILASGATPRHMGGPLSGINALNCNNVSQVNQLVENAASRLGVTPEQASSYVNDVNDIVQVSTTNIPEPKSTQTPNTTLQLPPKARELILGATEGNDGHIMRIGTMQGVIIRAGQRGISEVGNRREEAEWLSALDQLKENKLVTDRYGTGKRYDATEKGYSVADELRR